MAERTKETDSKKKSSRKTSIDGKILPNNYEAEQAVLGCALIDSDAALAVIGKLEEADFYNATHRYIFSAIRSLQSKAKPIDFITVSGELENLGKINDVGGMGYVSSLTSIVPSSASYNHYIELVKKVSILRQLIAISGDIIDEAYKSGSDESLIGIAEKKIYEIAEKGQQGSLEKIDLSVQKVIDNFELIHKEGGTIHGIKTGFHQIDKATNGLQKSDLIILAARPGVGKTSLAMNIVSNAALNSKAKCAVFSLEMGREQLARRMLCSVANVSMAKGMRGELHEEDWVKLHKAKKQLSEADIFIDDNALNTPSQVLSKCRKLKRERGLDLVVIDYLGLMKSDEKTDNRQNEVANISRQLKILAKEINVPVITLCQLNRSVEQRDDGKPGRPVLSDLRDSGSIEQDADMVWFIHRDMTKNELDKDPNQNYTAEIIIAKFRNGQPGSVFLGWDGSRTSFVNLEKDANEQSLVNIYEQNQESKREARKARSAEDIASALNNIVNEIDADGLGMVPPPEEENPVPDFSNISVPEDDELF